MGTLEDVADGNDCDCRKFDFNVDLSDVPTQRVDCGDLRDDGTNNFRYFTETMPSDDNIKLEDAFQTQLVDLSGETQSVDLTGEIQLMDLAGDTQLIDLAGETQVVDDVDCVKNVSTDLFGLHNVDIAHAIEYEATDKIKVMCDTQKLSEGDSSGADDGDSETLVNEVDTCSGNQSDGVSRTPSDTFSTEEHHSGSACRGFTSIHAASVRASGFAARARGVNLNSFSSEKSSLEQLRIEKHGASLVGDLSKYESKNSEEYYEEREKPMNPNKFKAPVRKLFTEDRVANTGPSKADINLSDENPEVPELHDSENFLAGLSYVNSEEPGELSQAIALEVVDKFLELNVAEYDKGLDCDIHFAEEANVGAIGSRDLAKSSILKNTDGECRAYDWDDTREDEGGGDFFQKKKELFFANGIPKERSFSEPRKVRGADLRNNESGADHGIEKEKACTTKELRNPEF